MRLLKFLVCTLPLAWAFAGCSEDSVVPDVGQGTDVPEGMHEVEVTFNMGANAGLQTRATAAPRPLESSDNWQRVTNMRIYVFRSETESDDNSDYTYYKPTINGQEKDYLYVSDFYKTKLDENGDISNIWGDEPDESENEEHTVTAKLGLENGFYKFLAVGRDDILEDNPDISQIRMTDPNLGLNEYPQQIQQQMQDIMTMADGRASWDLEWDETTTLDLAYIGYAGNPYGTEIFSGISSKSISITEETKGFQESITLDRAVAGLLFNVTNIPEKLKADVSFIKSTKPSGKHDYFIVAGTEYKVSAIGITTSKYNQYVVLPTRGLLDDYESYLVVNGETLNSRFIAFEQDVDFKDEDLVDGYYTTQLSRGAFIVPQASPEDYSESNSYFGDAADKQLMDKSLYLVIFGNTPNATDAGEYPLKCIPIKMIGEKVYNPSDDNYTNVDYQESKETFPIIANHLYQIEDVDLKKYLEGDGDYNIVITVNPDWYWKGELEWAD